MWAHRLMDRLFQALNFCLLVFGRYPLRDDLPHSRERRVWAHWSNENSEKDPISHENVYGIPYHGRCWLHVGRRSKTFRFSWNFWSKSCGLSIGADDEDGLVLHIAFPPVSFWMSIPVPFHRWWRNSKFMARWNEKYGGYAGSHRYTDFKFIDIRVFDWALWWSFLKFDWGWSKKMPKWMEGNWHPINTFLGNTKYTNTVLSTHDVVIPMPEGNYPATIKLELATWKRPRWFRAVKVYRADVEIPAGIPHQGKGENSWDCGEDATFGLTCQAKTLDEAIGKVVQTSLHSRRRYDGDTMAKYPPAVERIAAYEAREAKKSLKQNQVET